MRNKVNIKTLRLLEAKQDDENFKIWLTGDGRDYYEEEVEDLIRVFKKYKDSNLIRGEQSDYYYWMKKTQEEFIDFLAVIEHRVSETQKAKIDKEGAKFIKTINGYAVYLISSYEASLFYGRNTKWCISSVDTRDYWEQYTENGKIFFFFIKGDIKYCLVGKINYDSDYNEFENGEDEWDDDYIKGCDLIAV